MGDSGRPFFLLAPVVGKRGKPQDVFLPKRKKAEI
jgi:hypothetical protein